MLPVAEEIRWWLTWSRIYGAVRKESGLEFDNRK